MTNIKLIRIQGKQRESNDKIYMEQETVFVIMLKNKETGFLEKELGSLNINKNDEYIVNLFVLKEDDGEKLHLRISTDRDVEDWEYGAIFDNYNYDSYGDNVIEIDEIDNDYNPVWEIVIDYDDNLSVVEERVAEILDIHSNELKRVYEEIKEKLGVDVVRLKRTSEDMLLVQSDIDESLKRVCLIYENEDGTFFIGLVRKKTYATYEEAVDTVCERKMLQEIMGHKTIAITMQVYNHVLEGRAEAEMQRISSALVV